MREIVDLIQATKPFAKEDRSRSRWLLAHSLLVTLALIWGTTPPFPWFVRIFSSTLLGLTIVRLFIFYHDYLHGAIFRDSKAADRFFFWLGVIVLNPKSIWRRSHDYHHQHNAQMATASIGSYPVMTVAQYKAANRSLKMKYRLARHPLTIFFGYVSIFLMGMCLKSFMKDPKRHWDSAFALAFHFLVVGFLASQFGWEVAIVSFIYPLALSCALGAYLFYVQHNFPDMELKPREQWNFVFAALNSSSFMEASRFTHWFTGNIGYHHVHHLNARIPFYRLPEAMDAIPELHNPGRTSLHPIDIYRALRLKLWDPDRGEMVGFAPNPWLVWMKAWWTQPFSLNSR